MHNNSQLLFNKHVAGLFEPGMRVLEIGPSGIPSAYQKAVSADVVWDTLDIFPTPGLTYISVDEYSFPIPEGTYDIVVSGQVMEHVKKIWLWVRELERVCAPGGQVVIISPVSWPYHEAPVDCWRIYPEGMRALLSETSLEISHCDFESLEMPQYTRDIPGRSLEWVGRKRRWMYRLLSPLGLPVERSYDLVTIARKPLAETSQPEP